jgi:hypothetical protein
MEGQKQQRRSALRRPQHSTAHGSSWQRRRPPQSAACRCLPSGYISTLSASCECFANSRGCDRRLTSAGKASAAAPTLITVQKNCCSRTALHRRSGHEHQLQISPTPAAVRLAQTCDQHVVRRRSCAPGWAPAPARRARCCRRRRRSARRRSSAPMPLKREHCMAPLEHDCVASRN